MCTFTCAEDLNLDFLDFGLPIFQDIKALFPSDRNPFYAGFGNRDTDEFSYIKVGIPKGKIFIINPKVIAESLHHSLLG